MSEAKFEAILNWQGTGKEGEGKISIGEETLTCSGPANMGGKGVGVSPEDLLLGAVSTCYIGTLFSVLKKKRLPVQTVTVESKGIVTGIPKNQEFSKLIVNPTIFGGEATDKAKYEKAATTARDLCFIGQALASHIVYEVGAVQVEEAEES